jgi:SAM-dependent methyltransferase/uncharacterized protein YbaR (Trm112 family)
VRAAIEDLVPILRCPRTHAPLALEGDRLVTADGARAYPLVGGVPVLLDEEKSLFSPSDYLADSAADSNGRGGIEPVLRRVSEALPSLSLNVGTSRNWALLKAELRKIGEAEERVPQVLVVGGQIVGMGGEEFFDSSEFTIVETDVSVGPRTQIVCDAHDLPFDAGSFDAVVCQAVLEHVLDPPRAADEIRRVLRDRGIVYSEIPFMQQVHGGAFDFTRYTHLGHRRLWRHFDELASGAHNGPAMSLTWALQYFLISLGHGRLGMAIGRTLARVFLFWLPYLDRKLLHRPAAMDGAAGTYFLGLKRDSPVPDRVLVRGYKGVGARLDGPD